MHCKSNAGSIHATTEDESEIFVRKPKAKAFCEGCRITPSHRLKGGKVYRDGAKHIGIMIDNPVDGWLCPHCGHAITWYSVFIEEHR